MWAWCRGSARECARLQYGDEEGVGGDGQSPDEIYQLPVLDEIQAGLPSHHSGSSAGSRVCMYVSK